ncbi:hypothetical protein GCM10010236_81520 [Streptomyces eurythermus]|nr:hypothetical protein GCM10010236_81520 [Streptomyces eurythermus]
MLAVMGFAVPVGEEGGVGWAGPYDGSGGFRGRAREVVAGGRDLTGPDRWCIARTGGKPPRESSRYGRARVAGLAVQETVRAARPAPAAQDDAPAATASAATHVEDQHRDQTPDAPHAVDSPDRDAGPHPGSAGRRHPHPPADRDAA